MPSMPVRGLLAWVRSRVDACQLMCEVCFDATVPTDAIIDAAPRKQAGAFEVAVDR